MIKGTARTAQAARQGLSAHRRAVVDARGAGAARSRGEWPKASEARLALQKLALAVAWRTNQVTPITGIAIVTFALLAAGQRAVTMAQVWP